MDVSRFLTHTGRRQLWLIVLFWLLVTGCTANPAADEPGRATATPTEVGPTPTFPPGIIFPQTALIDGEWVRMTAAITGTLVEENGCIRVISSHGGTNYLVIWPHHYWPDVQDGRIQILDDTGQVAAVVGQETEVHMGGGEAPSIENTFYVPEHVFRTIPPECPGPYWISGGFILEQGLSSSIFVSPTFVPPAVTTPIPDPTLASPLPGWVWYESPNGVYTIAYPQQWQTGTVVGAGRFTFSSPETNSQIRIISHSVSVKCESNDGSVQFPDAPSATATPSPLACHDPSGTDWLDTVRVNRSSMPGLPYGTDITFNATFGGQPAYFHFSPAPGGGGGSSAVLLFCEAGTIVSLYYQSAKSESLSAEAAIYQEMLANFIWRGRMAVPVEIPTDWATGYHLAVIWPQLEPVSLSAEEKRLYQEGFEATVTELDVGKFMITLDSGQTIELRSRSYFFDSRLTPGQENPLVTPALEPGDRLFIIGRPVISLTGEQFLDGQYIAVGQSGQWQTVGFQTTFDFAIESLAPELLEHYPQDQPTRLRLLGSLEQIAPHLVDDSGALFEEAGLAGIEAGQRVLVHGILQSPNNPKLQVEELYVLEGNCRAIGDYELDCYPWQRIYPTVPPFQITATVSEIFAESGVIVLEQPVDGFITISLVADGRLYLEDGTFINLENIRSGQQIRAVGEPGQAGTLLAQEIEVFR